MAEDLRARLGSSDISRAGGFTLYPHLNRHGSTWRVFTQVNHSYCSNLLILVFLACGLMRNCLCKILGIIGMHRAYYICNKNDHPLRVISANCSVNHEMAILKLSYLFFPK